MDALLPSSVVIWEYYFLLSQILSLQLLKENIEAARVKRDVENE